MPCRRDTLFEHGVAWASHLMDLAQNLDGLLGQGNHMRRYAPAVPLGFSRLHHARWASPDVGVKIELFPFHHVYLPGTLKNVGHDPQAQQVM